MSNAFAESRFSFDFIVRYFLISIFLVSVSISVSAVPTVSFVRPSNLSYVNATSFLVNVSVNQNATVCRTVLVNYSCGSSSPAWWNTGWTKRKSINITTLASGAASRYPYLMKFTTASGFSTTCNELRVTDNSGNLQKIAYESGCGTANTYVWLQLNQSASTIGKFWIYYGNVTTAASVSSFTGVYPSTLIRLYTGRSLTDYVGGYTLTLAHGSNTYGTGRRGWASEAFYAPAPGDNVYTAANTGLPSGANPRTTCAWLSYTGTNDNYMRYVVALGTATGGGNPQWRLLKASSGDASSNKEMVEVYGAGANADGSVASATWRYVCAKYDGSILYFYENGTIMSQKTEGINTNVNSNLGIMCGPVYDDRCWIGYAEEIQEYSSSLTTAQIASNFMKPSLEPTIGAFGSQQSSGYYFSSMTITNANANTRAYKTFTSVNECTYKLGAFCTSGTQGTTKNYTIRADGYVPVINFVNDTDKFTVGNLSIRVNVSSVDTYFKNITIYIYNKSSNVLLFKNSSTNTNLRYVIIGLKSGNIYSVNATAYDYSGKKSSTTTRDIIVDITNPQISFIDPTKASMIDGISTIINISVDEANLKYINFTWKNATKMKNLTFEYDNLVTALDFDNYSTTNITSSYWGGRGVGGLWHVEETSGNRLDSSGNANTCVVTGNVSYVAGKFGNAAYFSGNSGGTADYLSCTTGVSLTNLRRTGTLVLWVKPKIDQKSTISPFYAGCLGSTGTWFYGGYGIKKSGSNFDAFIYNSTSNIYNDITMSGAGNTSQTTFIAMTWDGSRFIVYRNGELMGNISQTVNAHTSTCTFFIGGSSKYTNASLSGFVDEVYAGILPLSAREIKAMYQQTKYYDSSKLNRNYTGYMTTGVLSAKKGIQNTGFNLSTDMMQYVTSPWDSRMSSATGTVCMQMTRGGSLGATQWDWWIGDTGSTNNYLGGYDSAAGRLYMSHNNAGTAYTVITSTYKITDIKPHQICWSSSGTAWKIYVDGVSQALNVTAGSNNGNWLHDVVSPDVIQLFGYRYLNYGQSAGNRSFDNVLWFNKSLSDDSIAALYNVTFGKYINGYLLTFYKNNLKTATNYTYNALVRDDAGNINSTETRWLKASQPVYVTFKKKTPADIDTINMYGTDTNLTVTYNMTSLDGINKSTATLEYKTNNTKYDGLIIYNGTRKNTTSTAGITVKNISSNFTFTATALSVYPGEYPVDPTLFYLTQSKFQNFTSNSSGYKVKFRFMRNDTSYNSFEFMARNWTNYGIMHIIYCNRSYTTGQNFTTTLNCAQAGQIAAVDVYNHSLSQYDKQYLISIVINVTSGKISTVQVTNTSYFIFETPTGVWSMASITQAGGPDTIQYTDNEGISWINKSLSINADIRQYTGGESFWYRGCVNNNVGGRDCSSWGQDLLDLKGLPPGVFEILEPKGVWSRFVNISHTAALSPNNYAIANYTYSLVNTSFAQMVFIWYNKLNRTYEWNASEYNGTYQVKVVACDVQNECSSIYSLPFFIYNNSKSPVVHMISPSSGLIVGSASVALTCNATDEFNLRVLGLKIMNGSSVLFRSNRTIQSSYISQLSSSQIWNYNFTKTGVYDWYCFSDDGRFVANASEGSYSITADLTSPGISYVYPTPSNLSYSNKSITVNVTINENISQCILDWSGASSIDNWFNTSFGYRQKLYIIPTVSLPAGYQMKLQLSNLNVGTNFNWSSNCNDIRFANDSKYELSYWIQSCDSSAHTAVVWVNIPYAVSSEKFIYMYFGNNNVINASNASLTFDSTQWYNDWTQYSSDSCTGPVGWGNLSYDDSSWYSIPDVRSDYWDQGGAWDGDDYIRRRVVITDPTISYIDVESNDGQWVYINGLQASHNGGSCHQDGAVKANTTITSYINKGENLLTVHCSNGMPGEGCMVTEYQVPNSYYYKYVFSNPTYILDDNVYVGLDIMTYVNNDTNTYASGVLDTQDAITKYNVTCYDLVSNRNISKNYVVTMDTISPVLSYSIPSMLNGVVSRNPYLYANVSMSDVNSNYTFIRFYKDGIGLLNLSSGYAKRYVNLSMLSSGYYHINATGFDLAGNIGRLGTRNFTIDAVPPVVNHISPSNGTINNNLTLEFVCNYTDDLSLVSVGIKLWFINGTYIVIDSKNVSGTSVTAVWNYTGTTYQSKYWMCFASDNIGIYKTVNFTLNQYMSNYVSLIYAMPDSGCSINNGCRTEGCSICTYAAFNATKFQQYNVTPYGQTESLPFYNITNNGTTAINVTVVLNQTAVSGFKFKMSTTKAGNLKRVCSAVSIPTDDCMYVMDTNQHVLAVNVAPGVHIQGWLLTDVVGVSGGTKVERNISISAVRYAS